MSHNKDMANAIRYTVVYVSAEAAEAAAYAAGMKDDDGSSIWDWTDEYSHEVVVGPTDQFDKAVALAKQALPLDVFSEVQVVREVRDTAISRHQPGWIRDALWFIYNADDNPKADDPDHKCDRLADDEE